MERSRLAESIVLGAAFCVAMAGFQDGEITINAPAVNDKQAIGNYDPATIQFRYSATQTVTIYTENPAGVRAATRDLLMLGKAGIVLSQAGYQQSA